MPSAITRMGLAYQGIVLTNSVSTSVGFSLSTAAGALIMVDSVSGAASVKFYTKSDPSLSATYKLVDSTGADVSQTIAAGTAFELPAALFAARHVIMVTDAGTANVHYCVKG